MKPIKLVICAFSSYGNRTEIDFRIPNQNLFLITGDTGAGKSTIFDAIVFALYGETGSNENRRSGMELQSQFADRKTTPYVELEFEEKRGGRLETYHIRRIPRHRRQAKRGNADHFVEEKEQVELHLPDGADFTASLRETNQKIEETVGLTKDQFMQVAMIAQGEFWELLRASSDEKRKIFQRLFRTELYEQLVSELAARAKEYQGELSQLLRNCQSELKRLRVMDATVLGMASDAEAGRTAGSDSESGRTAGTDAGQALLQLQASLLKEKEIGPAALEALLSKLSEYCIALEAEFLQAKEKLELHTQAQDLARSALAEGEALVEWFGQRDFAKKELEAFEAGNVEMEERRRQAERIESAYALQQSHAWVADGEKRIRSMTEALHNEEALLPEYDMQKKTLSADLQVKKEAANAAIAEYAKIEARAEKAKQMFREIAQYETELSKIEKLQKELVQKMKTDGEWIDSTERRISALQEALKQKEGLSSKRLQLEREKIDLKEKHRLYKEMKACYTEAKKEAEVLRAADAEYLRIRAEYTALQQQFTERQNQFYDAQAGILAETLLKDGAPCPVCGSLSHPQPAKRCGSEIVSREELDQLLEQLEKQKTEQETAAAKTGRTKERYATYEEAMCKAVKLLVPDDSGIQKDGKEAPYLAAAPELIRSVGEHIKNDVAQWNLTHSKLEDAEEKLRRCEEELQRLEPALMQKKELRESDKEKLAAHRERVNAVQENLSKAQKEIESASLEAVEKLLSDGKLEKERCVSAQDTVAKTYEALITREQASRTRIKEWTEQLPALEQAYSEKKEEYLARLENAGMEEADWKSTVEAYAPEMSKALAAEVKQFDERGATARALYFAATEKIGEKSRPEIERLKEALINAEQQRTEVETIARSCEQILMTDREIYDMLSARLAEHGERMTKYSRILGLHRRLAGRVTNGRMDIETFVQRYYLRRILNEANRYFYDMTDGQFRLCMMDTDQAGVGKNHGLDLLVYSAMTGQEREVRTLSGGESFLAALSLALGMAGLIREKLSAINLDIMFVDEGFGTLDEHVRDQAIRVLQKLAEGDRMIGIISHVTELKQGIEDQLVVRKTKSGSSAVWQIS